MSFDVDSRPLGHVINDEMLIARQYIQNQAFYMVVPEPIRQYYLRFVRPNFWWYDGFVPFFHTSSTGIMPTNLPRVIVRKLANLTTGSKLLFDDEDTPDEEFVNVDGVKLNALDFTEYWSSKNNLNTKVTQGVEWSFVGGDSLLKLDNVQGDLIPKMLRKDEYYFSTDFAGNINHIVCFLYERVDTTKAGVARQYYLLEERSYDDNGKPQWRVKVKMGTGARPTYKDVAPVDLGDDVKIDQLPKEVRKEFRRLFPKVMLGEWNSLPLRDLGCYVLKASEKVSFLPALPYGESLYSNLISLFFTYDYFYNYFNTDMFLGQGKILVPDLWQRADDSNPLTQKVFTKLPYMDVENQKPVSIQFNLRADDWTTTRNNILQMIAMHLGINERTLLTAIVPASEKPSAHEISSDENSTTLFVEVSRRLYKAELDKMLAEVLNFYGIKKEKVYVKFSKLGLTNIQNIVNIVSVLKDRDLIDDETALEMIFTDKNNRQIRVIKERIEKQRKDKEKRENDNKNTLEEIDKANYENSLNQLEKPKE